VFFLHYLEEHYSTKLLAARIGLPVGDYTCSLSRQLYLLALQEVLPDTFGLMPQGNFPTAVLGLLPLAVSAFIAASYEFAEMMFPHCFSSKHS